MNTKGTCWDGSEIGSLDLFFSAVAWWLCGEPVRGIDVAVSVGGAYVVIK